ncbi:coiled-coil domain-containing protein 113-like [Pseudomyrmex gracilis]|uniref:coiled-coil domain-containing protein 113-like n=1 Tax=Pseudomyrmex gracilis TaxID=219809 RepID=UPI000994CC45|nr:coiled-coil domain-containing protein 113-like [Pseudomyrmex gracilis]
MFSQQTSVYSYGSAKQDEICYEDMTDAELQEAIEIVVRSNLLLRLENEVYEQYLMRRDPESIQTIMQTLEAAKRIQKIAPQRSQHSAVTSAAGSVLNLYEKDAGSIISFQSGSRHLKSPSILTEKGIQKEITGKIPYAYRIDMINTEIRERQKGLITLEELWTKKHIRLQAQIEEKEISIDEINSFKEEFEENIVKKGIDSITGKIPAEKFIRFIEESLKEIDITIERLRLKTATVKTQIRKVKLQLQHRKQMGEALRAIDFEQLNIENQVCIRQIDEKFQCLLQMKKVAGNYGVMLAKQKEKLNNLTFTLNNIRKEIASNEEEILKLQSEKEVIKTEIKKSKEKLLSITSLSKDFFVPSVIDFIKVRAELDKLHKIHKQLSRQLKIQQVTVKFNK